MKLSMRILFLRNVSLPESPYAILRQSIFGAMDYPRIAKAILVMTIISLLAGITACSTPQKELKSPCVGLEGSPCGKRSANPDKYII